MCFQLINEHLFNKTLDPKKPLVLFLEKLIMARKKKFLDLFMEKVKRAMKKTILDLFLK